MNETVFLGKKYKHYKGNEYLVLHVAKNSETLEDMVVYKALYGNEEIWVRPLNMFLSKVEIDCKMVGRFTCIEDTNMEHESVKKMWEDYLKFIGESVTNTIKNYTSWYFCDNEKSANDLAKITKEGIKRGTTSLYYWYEVENEKLPKEGEYSIITDWNGIAQCIIETKKVSVIAFKDVDEELAKIEGEGDKSLNYWREVHRYYFTEELKEKEIKFSEDMLVVFEEFEVVYI